MSVFVSCFSTSSSYTGEYYNLPNGFDGYATAVGQEIGITHIHCAFFCMKTAFCRSLEYNTESRDCKLYNAFRVEPSTNVDTIMFVGKYS